jgi:hypothetical protein
VAIATGDLLRTLRAKVEAEEDPHRRHIWFKVRVDGVVVRTTMVSHGASRQIGQPLLGKIARQLGLATVQLEALVQCTLTANEYYRLITESER